MEKSPGSGPDGEAAVGSPRNELPRGKPRGIKDRNPLEPRSKLRGIHHPAHGLSAEGRRKRDKKTRRPLPTDLL